MSDCPIIHIAFVDVYNYKGWVFEWRRGRPFSPWPLKKNGDLRERAGAKFYNDITPFLNLSKQDQDKFMVT